jgi:hypothetical protein
MSWEEDGRQDWPCPCGASTYTVVYSSDDWNRHRESWTMNCIRCRETHRLLEFSYQDSGRIETGQKWVTLAEYESSAIRATEQRAAEQARYDRIREVIAGAARDGLSGVAAYELAAGAGYPGGLNRFYRNEWKRARGAKR